MRNLKDEVRRWFEDNDFLEIMDDMGYTKKDLPLIEEGLESILDIRNCRIVSVMDRNLLYTNKLLKIKSL